MRVAEALNGALHALLDDDPGLHLLGEDVSDPYGGAFKITKGLSTRFPGQVLSTPLSEGGIVGVAGGLALAGDRAIVEIMFADFVALAFDQLLNFASKSVTMYGRRIAMPLVVRCPSGGGRGYGPTHSQSPHKHFIGIPGLSVFELSPFQEPRALFDRMLALGEPCLLFEDKVLYTRQMYERGRVDDLFSYTRIGADLTLVSADTGPPDCVLVAPGGMTHRAVEAMRTLLLEQEISCHLLVPDRLYPLDLEPVFPLLAEAGLVCVAEDGTAGGTWGAEVAHQIHTRLWGRLRRPVTLVHAADGVIPTAAHLEERVLVGAGTLRRTIQGALS